MIGIFDSGVGGLTVVKNIIKRLPSYDIVYFGDTARLPYGNKSPEVIEQYTLQSAQFLRKQGAHIIIIACHSASAVALDFVMENIDVPLFDVLRPAVVQALEVTKKGKIGVLGTRATINAQVYEERIREKVVEMMRMPGDESHLKVPAFLRKKDRDKAASVSVYAQAAPLLVPLIEENWLNRTETKRIVKYYLRPLKEKQIDTLILACTHYPLVKKIIAPRAGKRVVLVDPGEAIAEVIATYLETHRDIDQRLEKNKQRHFFVSDITPHFQTIAQSWLGMPVQLEKAYVRE